MLIDDQPSASKTYNKNHPRLQALTRLMLVLPSAKSVARHTTRFAIQKLPLSQKNKERCYNLIAADAAALRPVICQVSLPGGGSLWLELDLSDPLSREWYYWGYKHYERSVVSVWSHLLSDAISVFDVGANIGFYTLLAAARLSGRGEVHAFEPNPRVFSHLARNAQHNSLMNLHLVGTAVCDFDGEASFYLPRNGAWANGSMIEGFTEQLEPLSLKTSHIDTYCSKAGIRRIDLIKIDAEGAELKVLKGMGSLLQNWKPDVICEVLEGYAASLNEFFRGTPYRKFLITQNGLQESSSLRPHQQFRDYYLSCEPDESLIAR
jgi:FkbM family methyltransferase